MPYNYAFSFYLLIYFLYTQLNTAIATYTNTRGDLRNVKFSFHIVSCYFLYISRSLFHGKFGRYENYSIIHTFFCTFRWL